MNGAQSVAAGCDLFDLPEPKEPTKVVTLRMPESLIKRLDEVAKQLGHDRTKIIVHFCKAALEQLELTQAEQKGDGSKPRTR